MTCAYTCTASPPTRDATSLRIVEKEEILSGGSAFSGRAQAKKQNAITRDSDAIRGEEWQRTALIAIQMQEIRMVLAGARTFHFPKRPHDDSSFSMRVLLVFLLAACAPVSLFAAPPEVPAEPIGKKGELLFSDNFEGTVAAVWHKVVPTFVVENGALKATQTRDMDVPAADGKPAVKAHAAVHGLEVPTKDSIVEVKIRFEGASMLDVEFDDRKYTGAHYGHICRAQVRLNTVQMIDERDGNMRNDIREMRQDPARKAEGDKLLAGRSASFPVALEKSRWYTLQVEIVGDEMRVSIDDKAVGYLKSSGIGHATKSKIELGCAGKDGFFDDIKVWNALPAGGK